MKLLIEVPSSGLIELPIEMAGVAAGLMASGRVVQRDGYNNPARYKPCEEGLTLSYIADERIQPMTERESDLAKQLSDKNNDWAKQYTENAAKTKTIAAMQEQLDLLKSVTVCTIPDAGETETTETYAAGEREPDSDEDLPF